ncbi:MAG: imidazolonepropionase [Flavobacterium sp.]|nr:imidazolonepropionase [Flavobacterium sp.]
MSILLTNIKSLLQIRPASVHQVAGKAMAELPELANAYLLIENDCIADFGPMHNCPDQALYEVIDATDRFVFPSWCDSHSHLVYAGNREQEFVDRINGLSYQEIAAKGGGILNSAAKLQETSEDELYTQAEWRLQELVTLGTGALEIKSGYGLNVDAELKMLRVIQRLKANYPVAIKATFLGAHAFPKEFASNHVGYIDQLIHEMLPAVAQENLADYIDVFCEEGYFSVADTIKIMQAGAKHQLTPKIHVNQFNALGGVAAGVAHQALSVDHLEILTPDDIQALQNSKTMPVALPGCSYFLGIPYTPAREILDANLPLALASDYNPGSCPSGNMNFVVATACIKMKLTPEEAINAATLNGAYAMGLADTHGSITVGKKANLIITKKLPSYYQIPYAFGSNPIAQVILNGKVIA